MRASKRDDIGNLPIQLTSFVGRKTEVTDVKRLLTTARLVTLTGIGGIGKTRLALRVASDLRRASALWLLGLVPLISPTGAVTAPARRPPSKADQLRHP